MEAEPDSEPINQSKLYQPLLIHKARRILEERAHPVEHMFARCRTCAKNLSTVFEYFTYFYDFGATRLSGCHSSNERLLKSLLYALAKPSLDGEIQLKIFRLLLKVVEQFQNMHTESHSN